MQPKHNAQLVPLAKQLRRHMTKEERRLWYGFLRRCPVRFSRQKVLGKYIVDFYCDRAKLIIELDGSQHFEATGIAQDQQRDLTLSDSGYSILRYANSDVNRNFHGVCEDILAHLPAGTKVK